MKDFTILFLFFSPSIAALGLLVSTVCFLLSAAACHCVYDLDVCENVCACAVLWTLASHRNISTPFAASERFFRNNYTVGVGKEGEGGGALTQIKVRHLVT